MNFTTPTDYNEFFKEIVKMVNKIIQDNEIHDKFELREFLNEKIWPNDIRMVIKKIVKDGNISYVKRELTFINSYFKSLNIKFESFHIIGINGVKGVRLYINIEQDNYIDVKYHENWDDITIKDKILDSETLTALRYSLLSEEIVDYVKNNWI